MQEAIDYVEEGIQHYEKLIQQAEARLAHSAQNRQKSILLVSNETTSEWPMVRKVDPRPLLIHVERLSDALDYIGNPLPEKTKAKLLDLQKESNGNRLAEAIQQLLDPLCLVAVDIHDGKLTVEPQAGEHEVVQKGWRGFLVKVCNRDGLESRLRVESPNARSMPHSKQEDLASRWLGLRTFDGWSLKANLNGQELEYRIVLLYSRDEGEKKATLDFSIDAKPDQSGRQIREWRFDEGTDGWQAENQSEINAHNGSLFVNSTGFDPFITAKVAGPTGKLVMRFQQKQRRKALARCFGGRRNAQLPMQIGWCNTRSSPVGHNSTRWRSRSRAHSRASGSIPA